jgi:uncharacterized membrane protein (DUF2068 family)
MPTRDPQATEALAVANDRHIASSPTPSGGAGVKHPHARGLLIVGVFKLSKAIFFAALGAGALQLIHHNIGDIVQRVVDALRITAESRLANLANFAIDRADLIGHHQLREASIFAFIYSALCLIEGTGLIMRKVWAEYFTVILTTAALPWEGYEIVVRYTVFKLALLFINLVVLIYLLWVLKRKKAMTDSLAI